MARKDRMGSGLDMLFEDNFHESDDGSIVRTLRLSLIEPDKDQPRKNFDRERLQELADNISTHGILQPILVRPLDNGSYMIVAGERRWRAARLAGLTEVPVIVRELDEFEAAQIALIENLQREDLDPIDEALAYKRLMDVFGMTQEEVAKAVGKSRSGIANSVRLLNLPDQVQDMLSSGTITTGHAKLIAGVDDELEKLTYANYAAQGATVRELENKMNGITPTEVTPEPKPPQLRKRRKNREDDDSKFNQYAAEAALAFKRLCGIETSIFKERGGALTMKLSFGDENELMDFITRISDSLE